VIAASIINPIYEEVLLVGYIIGALKGKKGIVFAINISVLFRFLCHLYQGPLAAIEIIPMDLLFAYVYHRWEKLFPLIVAHGILHYIGFLRLSSL
jgi:membrane protease YdiL (CAAX protease family)